MPSCLRVSLSAFTLIELLVVIGIIAILIGILVPVVSKVRGSAQRADTANFITLLTGAIERYHTDFGAYPGPVSNNEVWRDDLPPGPDNIYLVKDDDTELTPALGTVSGIFSPTMSENLVLGLLGGLYYNPTTGHIQFSMQRVISGQGPTSVNKSGATKQYAAYLEPRNIFTDASSTGFAKSGKYSDDAGAAKDTIVPEFLDRFSNPMPILYLRAKTGARQIATTDANFGNNYNSIITDNSASPPAPVFRAGQYDISQVLPYTGQPIGVGKKIPWYYVNGASATTPSPPPHGLRTVKAKPAAVLGPKGATGFDYPYDAFPYFSNPAIPNSARQKDSYILISAGPDRVYGTTDDIANFGSVVP